MSKEFILLNGGDYHEVALLPDVDAFLARVLGSEPERRAVPTLRAMPDDEGNQRVAVFIGNQQVGHLSTGADAELLATVKACELNGAIARARGSLMNSWEEPGKVKVRVSLAGPEDLVSTPQATTEGATPTSSPMSASLEEAGAYGVADDAQPQTPPAADATAAPASSDAPALSAGSAHDFPDWPPPNIKSVGADSPLPAGGPAAMEQTPATEHSPIVQAPSGPSPEALLATRSAWAGEGTDQSEASQPGWLGVKRGQGETASASDAASGAAAGATAAAVSDLGASAPTLRHMSASTPTPSSVGGLGADYAADGSGATVPPSGSDTEMPRAGDTSRELNHIDNEIVAAWGSSGLSGPSTQTVTQPLPAKRSSSNTNWVLPLVALVVVVAIGLLVWKFVFAPKTYTDPDHGYSFSYPAGWEVLVNDDTVGDYIDSSMMAQFTAYTGSTQLPSMVMIGDGLDRPTPDEMALVAVARAEVPPTIDRSLLETQMQASLNQVSAGVPGLTVLEPVRAVDVGGLDGWKTTISIDLGIFGMTMAYCFLLDGDVTYTLMAMGSLDSWSDRRGDFDRFFDSFKPG